MKQRKRYLLFTMLALGLGVTGINNQLPEENTVSVTKAAESGFVIGSDGILTEYNGTDTDIVIPGNVTGIVDRVFYNNTNVTKITIPDSVTTIGNKAFWNCKNLKEINIPDGVTAIGSGAFKNCKGLTGIAIPDNVKTIETALFSGCSNLKEVLLPDGITDINAAAFESCKNLTGINLPESLVNLGDSAFSGCQSLNPVTVPGSLKTMGNWAFSGCKKLSAITIPEKTTQLGNGIFDNCTSLKEIKVKSGNEKYVSKSGVLFEKKKSGLTLIVYPAQKKGNTYKLPGKTDSIESGAFTGCKKLKGLVITSNIKNINYTQASFWGFTNLKNIKITMKKGEKVNISINLSLQNADDGIMPKITSHNKNVADIKLPSKDNYFKDDDTDHALVKGTIKAKKNGKSKIIFQRTVTQNKQTSGTTIKPVGVKLKTTLDITVK